MINELVVNSVETAKKTLYDGNDTDRHRGEYTNTCYILTDDQGTNRMFKFSSDNGLTAQEAIDIGVMTEGQSSYLASGEIKIGKTLSDLAITQKVYTGRPEMSLTDLISVFEAMSETSYEGEHDLINQAVQPIRAPSHEEYLNEQTLTANESNPLKPDWLCINHLHKDLQGIYTYKYLSINIMHLAINFETGLCAYQRKDDTELTYEQNFDNIAIEAALAIQKEFGDIGGENNSEQSIANKFLTLFTGSEILSFVDNLQRNALTAHQAEIKQQIFSGMAEKTGFMPVGMCVNTVLNENGNMQFKKFQPKALIMPIPSPFYMQLYEGLKSPLINKFSWFKTMLSFSNTQNVPGNQELSDSHATAVGTTALEKKDEAPPPHPENASNQGDDDDMEITVRPD